MPAIERDVSSRLADFLGARGGGGYSAEFVASLGDLTQGPTPPCELWEGYASSPAVVGGYSICAIVSSDDPTTQHSIIVIDRIVVNSGGNPVILAATNGVPSTYTGGLTILRNANTTPNGPGVSIKFYPQVNVCYRNAAGATPSNYIQRPCPAGTAEEIIGPWLLGPQQTFEVANTAANVALNMYAIGRYYGSA